MKNKDLKFEAIKNTVLKQKPNSMIKALYDAIRNGETDENKLVKLSGFSKGKIDYQINYLYKRCVAPTATVSSVTVNTVTGKNMTKFIPVKNGNYVTRSIYGTTDMKLVEGAYVNKDFIILEGETGSGKTHLIRHFCYENKLPYMRVNLNGATTPEDLVGQWQPNDNAENPAKYIWKDGVLTEFMRYGGVVVIDEPNMAAPDILAVLHSISDDERRLVLTQKDGEVIHAHPNFWLAMTMNPEYEGTKPLNVALKSRFRIIQLQYNDRVEEKLGISESMRKIAKQLRNSDAVHTPVSTRELLQYEADTKHYSERIAKEYFLNKFDILEKDVVKEVLALHKDKPSSDEE